MTYKSENKLYNIPRRKDGILTFNKILKASEELFTERGFYATSINLIIEKANVSTGSFYMYFKDKTAVYKYLIELYGKKIRDSIKKATFNAKSRYEEERNGLKAFLMFVINNPVCYKIFWESMYVDSNIFSDYYIRFAKGYEKALNKWKDKNQVRKDLDLDNVSYMLMGVANFVGLKVLFENLKTDTEIELIVDDCMKMLENGILTKR